MTIWTRVMAAWNAFKDPESQKARLTIEERMTLYGHAWAYYRNEMFSRRNGADWTSYLSSRELYKQTRLIYNPVTSVVDFYVDHLLSAEPKLIDDILQLITPVDDGADELLVAAIAQLDQWGGWDSESQRIKRFAAATGNVLIEVDDDLEREKVRHRIQWPSRVTQLELNNSGDVLSYTIEYDVKDKNETWRFKKIVTKESISYFKGDRPFVPVGKTNSVEPNPYGFTPAVWIKHIDDGGDLGTAAFTSLDKLDEVNSVASHAHDCIHKDIESPKVIATDGEIIPISGATVSANGTVTAFDPRLDWLLLKAPKETNVLDLAGTLKLAEAHPFIKDCLASFSNDYPELQAAIVIQQNSQLSGAALERMLAPAQSRLDRAAANYNPQLIKLRQMQIAIAGWRRNGGGWTTRTPQQEMFRGFNLNSYSQGLLNFRIKRSLLVQPTEAEQEDLLIKKAERASKLKDIVDSKEALMVAGYSEEDATRIAAAKKAEREANMATLPPNPPQEGDNQIM